MTESFLYAVIILPVAQATCIIGITWIVARLIEEAIPLIIKG